MRLTEPQQTLVEENVRLAYYMAQKWNKNLPRDKYEIEELNSLCTLALCKAARAFDPEKGVKFATFAARCMDNEILMTLRKDKNRWRLVSLDQPITKDPDGNELTIRDIVCEPKDTIEEWIKSETVPALMAALPERDRTMINRIYFQDEGQRVIGTDMGLSQSYVSRIRNKALQTMKKEAMKDQVAWF